MKREKLTMKRENLTMKREKLTMKREKLTTKRENLTMKREKLTMKRERMFTLGPPSSPPTAGERLANRIRMASRASIQNTVTENPKLNQVDNEQGL